MKEKPFYLLKNAAITAGILAASSAVCFVIQLVTSEDFCAVAVFILGAAFTARFTEGYLWGILSSVAGTVLVNWAFTEPFYVLNASVEKYPLTFVSLLTASVMINMLTTRLRRQSELKVIAEKEKMRADLLRSVSHDIRTPLTSISGAAETYLGSRELLSEQTKTQLVTDIRREADRLTHMIENIFVITRMDVGDPDLHSRPEAAEEVIGEVVGKFRTAHPDVTVNTEVPRELVMVPMDVLLVEQAIRSILESFTQRADNVADIDIKLTSDGKNALFSFENNGGNRSAGKGGMFEPPSAGSFARGKRWAAGVHSAAGTTWGINQCQSETKFLS